MKKYIFSLFVFLSTLYQTPINAQTNTPPNWAWATNITGFESGATSNNYKIHTDKTGNSYVIDQVNEHVNIVKYDANGKLLWNRVGSSGNAIVKPTGIVVDIDGNYYVSGYFKKDAVTFGSFILTQTVNKENDFIVKYSADGKVLWAKKSSTSTNLSSSNIYATSLAVDANKNVYFTGYTTTYNSSTRRNNYRGIIVKFNEQGVEQWNKYHLFSNSAIAVIYAVEVDDFGNVYATGIDDNKGVIFKYDSFGNLVWNKERTDNSIGLDITADNVGNSYVVGSINESSTNKDVFLAKYDAAGNKVWEQQGKGDATNIANGVAIDANGSVYITGYFQQKTTFGPYVIENSNSGVSDIFVAKYNNLGDILWVQKAGNNGADSGGAIGVDEAGNCFINGYYTLSTAFGDTTIQGNNQFIPFLAKIGDFSVGEKSIATLPVASSNFNAGGAIKVPFATKGIFAQDTKFTVQLSNSSGSFFNPTFIGIGTASPINAIIPSLTLPGSGYRVRVITETPEILGTDNGSALTINNNESLITPNWDWATKIGAFNSGASNSNYSLHTDKDGNSFTIYQVNNQLHISKVDANGTILWARVGSEGDDATVTPTDIVVDADGNYYVSGYFMGGDVTFFNITLEHTVGRNNDFVVKYDKDGNVLWAKKSSTSANSSSFNIYATSLAVDANKNVYFTGYTTTYNSSTRRNNYRGVIVKYSEQGVELWNKYHLYSSSASAFIFAVDVDDFGNVYGTGIDDNKGVVFKYDPFGNLVWNKERTDNSTGLDITADNVGNSYVVGRINTSNQGANAFVAKYDAAGNKVWEQQGIGDATDIANGVAIDDNGNVFVTGRFQHNTDFSTLNVTNSNSGTGDVFVAKYDTDGNIIWVQQAGDNGADSGTAIGVDKNGNCYVNGYFTVKGTFGETTLLADGQFIPILAKIGESAPTSLVGNAIVKGENFCGGSVITVDYAIGGKYEEDNVFTAQLSDKDGSFTNPTDIGTLESPRNTSIYAIIPLDIPKGEGYRVRVTSSNPALIGNANEIDIKLNQDDCKDNTNELTAKPIVAAEYFIDTDPGVNKGTAIEIEEGLAIEKKLDIVLPALAEGFHSIFIRTKDGDGNWSMYDGRVFYIQPKATILEIAEVVAGEYFFDTEPGIGKGTALESINSNSLIEETQDISIDGLSEGFHNLFLRTKDATGKWSMYEGRVLYIQPNQVTTEIAPIVAAEYYFNSDPGFGNGISINTGDPNIEITTILENIETSSLDKGKHDVFIRVKNKKGTWSLTENGKFTICSNVLEAPIITGDTNFCSGSNLTLSASTIANATGYKWTGPNNFTANTQSITINNLRGTNSGEYVVIAVNDTAECTEGNPTKIDIKVNETEAPIGESVQEFKAGNTIADIVVTGTNVKWYSSASEARNATNPLDVTTELVNSKTYYGTQTVNGCESILYLEVTMSLTLGTEELSKSNFGVYPNPVNNILNITNSDNITINNIMIFNVLGKKIEVIQNPKNSINIANLVKGIYFLNINTEKGKIVRKIVKK